MTIHRTLIALTAPALITAGCNGPDTGSADSPTPPSTISPSDMTDQQQRPNRLSIDVTIASGNVTPTNAQLQGKVKEPIVIRVDSDAADELHVHSVPEHTFNVEPRAWPVLSVRRQRPGTVAIELHDLNRTVATIQVQ